MGHKAGCEAVEQTVRDCAALGVKYLTVYGFSTENWSRPEMEVAGLMSLFRYYIRRKVEAAEMPFDHPITVSVGAAAFDPGRDNEFQLFKDADEALYQAKKAGRNAVYALGLGRVKSVE